MTAEKGIFKFQSPFVPPTAGNGNVSGRPVSFGCEDMDPRLQAVVQQFFPVATVQTDRGEVKKEPSEDVGEKEEKPLGVLNAGVIGEFVARNGYSPEEHVATPSERDESPHSIASPDAVQASSDVEDAKPFMMSADMESELQKYLVRLQQAAILQEASLKADITDVKPGKKIDNLAEKLSASAVPTLVAALSNGQQQQQQQQREQEQRQRQQQGQAIIQQLQSPLLNNAFGQALALQLQQQVMAAAAQKKDATTFSPSALAAAFAAAHQQFGKQQLVPPSQPSAPPPAQQSNGYSQSPKRKRQRRNPVWPYFDVIDGVARCKQCAYSTRSVFSTNLKVHLRSHHRADYEKVIEAEDQLNLNALLLSGNPAVGGLIGRNGENTRKRHLPPMTSSIMLTISKLAAQNDELTAALALATKTSTGFPADAANAALAESALAAALRQALASQLKSTGASAPEAKTASPNDLTGLQSMAASFARAAMQHQQQQEQPQLSPRTITSAAPSDATGASAAETSVSSSAATTSTTTTTAATAAVAAHEKLLQQLAGLQQQLRNGNSPGPGSTDFSGLSLDAFNNSELPQPKRRRLRRHPVWMFFRDLEDRMVGCINCNFRTGSAFSTNLKMHLKAHHKDDYSKVLKLEDDMRIEEGVFGQPNKIKTELIDFIRGGGNASTPVDAATNGSAPKPSPLVQQFIQQTLAGRQGSPTSPSPSPVPTPNAQMINHNNNNSHSIAAQIATSLAQERNGSSKNGLDEDSFNGMSMSERLAALVGLMPQSQEDPSQEDPQGGDRETNRLLSEEHAEILSRFGLNPSGASNAVNSTTQNSTTTTTTLSVSALNAFSGSSNCSDAKSCTSSSADSSSLHSEERRSERDRAVARVAEEHGETVVQSHSFKELLRTLAPEYEFPEQSGDVAEGEAPAEEDPDLTPTAPINLETEEQENSEDCDVSILGCTSALEMMLRHHQQQNQQRE